MRRIPLTQGKFALVDDADFDYLSQWKWYVAHGYAVRTDNRRHRQVRMHRELLQAPSGMDVDHANGDRLDNRRRNIRVCTRSQNVANTFVAKQNRSGYKGVSWKTSNQKWCAQIRVNNRVIHIGLFADIKEAARAYNKAAKASFGEFAVLNRCDG